MSAAAAGVAQPPVPVGLVTYSVKPRGGVVHTLALAEALHQAGYPVRVVALGDPGAGFFRPVRAPFTIIPAPPGLPTLEQRVFASVGALAEGLGALVGDYPILHTQDCISARAACQVRDRTREPRAGGAIGGPRAGGAATGREQVVIRTVHHVDDFTSRSLIDCQRQAILEPDRILVVSEHWRGILRREYGTAADVVHNGVDVARFAAADRTLAAALRRRAGAADRQLILAVGGIEPRKGSDTLVEAVASLRRSGRRPVLAVLGGHSFQDYRDYRERVLASLPGLGLRLDDDLVLLGTVADTELPAWYAAADVLAFPSTKEGWGLAVLEAMSAGLPVVTSDLAVFREYLQPGRDALLVPVDDASALAAALASVLDDRPLAGSLRSAGRKVAARYSWARSAAEHQAIYARAGWTLSGRAITAPGAAAHGSHPARNRQVRSVAPPSGGSADPASSQGHSP